MFYATVASAVFPLYFGFSLSLSFAGGKETWREEEEEEEEALPIACGPDVTPSYFFFFKLKEAY